MFVKNSSWVVLILLAACSSSKNSSEQDLAFQLSELKMVKAPESSAGVASQFELKSQSHKHYWHCLNNESCETEYAGSFFLHDTDTGVVPLWASVETDLLYDTCNVNFELDTNSDLYTFQKNAQYAEYGWPGKKEGRTDRVVGKAILRSPIYGTWEVTWKSNNCY
ncbi:hypothetical protein [Photobacterium sp. TY1-4]|uniref:hypothetical protein n=1 Tax=Photobacterium sp. TY1-4 TaxID=2899122 RepID=UPI0021C0E622|nr:hypothetical protein [Photobacterium sp. TY1-4]UXI02381.1 hypothetical protein NH461_06295 [Photobacterium sp. TY1-4]